MSLSPLYFNKTLLHKSSEWSSLVSGPGSNSSPPEAKNPSVFRGSTTIFQLHTERIINVNIYWLVHIHISPCLYQLRGSSVEMNVPGAQSSGFLILVLSSVQFNSVSQLCPILCDPMDCSTPGFPVHHQLLELIQIHVCWVRWCHQTISSSVLPVSSCLQAYESGGQSIGVSASASVFPMNIQDWFPSGWTALIHLLSKGLSRVFSNTTVQKHQFFGTQLSL